MCTHWPYEFWPMILTYESTYDFDLWFWPMSETYELTYDENHRSPMRRNHRSPMIHDLRIHVVRHTNKRTYKSFITIINRAIYAALIGSLNTQKHYVSPHICRTIIHVSLRVIHCACVQMKLQQSIETYTINASPWIWIIYLKELK